ncbi:hypothetical protein RN001_010814 [Aquatica leii]|uniref:CRAL-TRIO domain-containing protein n=1 Tax=Aquatica leii TaxID=1421715 RepID=A0AAN7SNF9_9COLE|nr:hypothetical protein RN001_010814 [Aquatica leii]
MAAVKFGYTADKIIDETTKENIEALRQLLVDENLPELTNEQILQFLWRSGHDLCEAKRIITGCYHLRAKVPQIFSNRKARTDLNKIFGQLEICTMPERTEDGNAILFVRVIDTNYKNISMEDYFKAYFMTLDSLLYQGPLKGVITIYDLTGISLMHLTRIKLSVLKTIIAYLQEGLPVEIKQVHCLNCSSFMDAVLKLIKPFVRNDFLEKSHFHTRNVDMDAFYANHLEKKYLPEDLGGDLPSTKTLHERNVQLLADLEEHFDAEEAQRNRT